MSRFTSKPHGLTVCWDNEWSYTTKGPDGPVVNGFPCMVAIDRYQFEDMRGYVANIRTPAQQLLAFERMPADGEYAAGEIPDDESLYEGFKPELRAKLVQSRLDARRRIAEPTRMARQWLDANTPGWSCAPDHKIEDFGFYFVKKQHALAFCAWVDSILAGMKYWNEK